MLDIPKIYNDPIRFHKRSGTPLEPYKRIKESIVVDNYYALLNEVPNRYEKVKVTGLGKVFHEVENDFLSEDTFVVEYEKGRVKFHESLEGKTLNFEYLGEGVYLFPDSRIYLTGEDNFPTARDKFEDIDRAILVQKNRVDEQMIKLPQPSEVVDTRIDYNGKVFRVAKDRLDAEQRKIEEAYFDAKGKKHSSLKARIDSLEFATELDIEDVENEQVDIWAAIDLIPGQISLETGRVESKFDNRVATLDSKIELIPEQIGLSVSEVREWADGKFSSQLSTINVLSNRIEMKVDVDGVTSAINLDKSGVRIKGEKIRIDGETHIDRGVIKSAMIEDLDASKIKAGTIDAINITGSTIQGSLIRGTNIYVDGNKPEFLYSNAMDTNPETNGVHIYIRPTADGEVRTTKTHTRDEYVSIRTLAIKSQTGKNAYVGTDGELRIMSQGLASAGVYRNVRANIFHGTAIDLRTQSDANNFYVRPSNIGEVRITTRGTTNRYRPIAASEFKIRSSRDSKENIKPVTKKGLNVIRKLDVVRYNYIGDDEKKMGVIAEKSPEITDKEQEFVNMTELMMFLLLSVQELDEEVTQLKQKERRG